MPDITILGAGPSGSSSAIALARRGLDVVLIERRPTPIARVGESLASAARPTLERLGIWPAFAAQQHAPAVGNRSVWGSDRAEEVHFIASANGGGWHLDRRAFETMLIDEAERAGVEVWCGAELDALRHDDGVWQFRAGDRTCSSRYAVDASGRASVLARACGAERVAVDQLVAITAFFDGIRDVDRFTLIEAVRDGWWYSAALPDARLVVAYMTDADLVRGDRMLEPDFWRAELARTSLTRERTGDAPFAEPPRLASAATSRLSVMCGRTWLAAGDAAIAFDPLSSQGIETALRFGLEAADAIVASMRGDEAAMDRYASSLAAEYRQYLVDRARYYAIERRWPESRFWQRRHGHVSILEAAHA